MITRRSFGSNFGDTFEIAGDTLLIRKGWFGKAGDDVVLTGAAVGFKASPLGRLVDFGSVTVTVGGQQTYTCANIFGVSDFHAALSARAKGESQSASSTADGEASAIPAGVEFASHLLLLPWLGGPEGNATVTYDGGQRNRWVDAGDCLGWIKRSPDKRLEHLYYRLFPGSQYRYAIRAPVSGIVVAIPSGTRFPWTTAQRSGRAILLPEKDAHIDKETWRDEAWKQKRKIQRKPDWWELGEDELMHAFESEEIDQQEIDRIVAEAKPRSTFDA